MKPDPSFIVRLVTLSGILCFAACSEKPKYKAGEYLMPSGSSDPATIVKVIAVSDSNYKVFTHFISGGQLIEVQDYDHLSRSDVDAGYVVVEPPKIEGTISPDRYISELGDRAIKPSAISSPSPRTVGPNATEFPIPAVGITLVLPKLWQPMRAELIRDYNESMLRLRPQTSARYVAGYTRGPVSSGIGTEYIWIQSTPSPIPPDQLLALIPKTLDKNKTTFDELLKETIQSSAIGKPYYDRKVGAVVLPSSSKRQDGQDILGIAYLLPTQRHTVTVSVQSSPSRANIVFTEAHIGMSALVWSDDAKPSKQWQERLNQLLNQ